MSLQLILICSKCGKRVPRETCVIDDYGEVAHDGCAIATLPSNHPTVEQKRFVPAPCDARAPDIAQPYSLERRQIRTNPSR